MYRLCTKESELTQALLSHWRAQVRMSYETDCNNSWPKWTSSCEQMVLLLREYRGQGNGLASPAAWHSLSMLLAERNRELNVGSFMAAHFNHCGLSR